MPAMVLLQVGINMQIYIPAAGLGK